MNVASSSHVRTTVIGVTAVLVTVVKGYVVALKARTEVVLLAVRDELV